MYSDAFVKGGTAVRGKRRLRDRRGPYYGVHGRNRLSTLIVCREPATSSGHGTHYERCWL